MAEALQTIGSEGTYIYDGLKVHVLQGDITKEETDCVLNSSNLSLDLGLGAVSIALLIRAGRDLEKACLLKKADMERDEVVLTTSGRLKCLYVLHVNAKGSNLGWTRTLLKALKLAAEQRITSLSIPAVGTGDMGLSAEEMSNTIAETLKIFWNSNKSTCSLKLIRLVIFEKSIVSTFTSAFSDGNHGFVPLSNIQRKTEEDKSEALYFTFEANDFYRNPTEEYHYRIAESQFFRYLGSEAAKFTIDEIEYVQNTKLMEKFRTAQMYLKFTRGTHMSHPILAFHGTDSENVKKICQKGFLSPGDVGFVMRVGNKFGNGVYFSEYPQYCMKYLQGSTQLLLCQVLIGKAFRCKGHEHGIPLKTGFDSHISPLGKELVIFNTSCILPVYIIHCNGCDEYKIDLTPEV